MSLVTLPPTPITCRNLVGGEWVSPKGAPVLDVQSPWTGGVVGQVPLSRASDVDAAVQAAAHAAVTWRQTPLRERTQRLFRFRELLLENLERIGNLAAVESGKTVAEGKAGLLKGLEVAEFALSLQNLDLGGMMEVSRGITCEFRREPLGVVAGIVPFNFPAMVPMWMFPIAVTLGNTFILKPSEKVPLTSQVMGELMLEAGYPPGVFTIVNGGREAVESLLSHPQISAVAFVGSSPVAKKVYEAGAAHGKRVLALGGAKNHVIVVPDAELEMTSQGVLDSFTGCAGQRCMAGSVMLAVGDVQPIVDRMVEKAKAMALGANMGAIIDRHSVERITRAIDAAEKAGAKVLVDGRNAKPADPAYAEGSWLGPTILDDVTTGMEAWKSEIFGPVLSIVRVPTLSAALEVQHASSYGNACSVFTSSGAVAQQVAEQASAGMIGVNVGVPVPREPFSFGGVNDSRYGHGDITGPEGVSFWTQLKKITRKWTSRTDGSWMS